MVGAGERALRALGDLHERERLCAPPPGAEALPAPWFLDQDGTPYAFNGLTPESRVVYVGPGGTSVFSEERAQPVLLAFQRLLGKTAQREADFRRLLGSAAPEDFQGVLMGDYLVGRPVGHGGFATVHVGRQLTTGRKVAIKILRDGMEEDARARFQSEAKYLSRLNHPNVVGVLGYGEETWTLPRSLAASMLPWLLELRRSAPVKTFIALEWIDGRTLDALYADVAKERLVPHDARWGTGTRRRVR